MTYDGRNYLAEIRVIFTIIIILSVILFCSHNKLGIFLVLGLFFYFMFFICRDKKMKKEELDNLLSPKKSRMVYNRRLSTEMP